MLTKELLSEYIDAGAAKIKADMVIIGGTLVNVNTEEYYPANVAIYKNVLLQLILILKTILVKILELLTQLINIWFLG